MLDALFILAYSNISGFLLLFDIIRPKYLNSSTVFTSILSTFRISTQFTYIALVFVVFITKSFYVLEDRSIFISKIHSLALGFDFEFYSRLSHQPIF